MYVHMYVRMYTCTYVCMYVHMYVCTYIKYIHMYVCTYVHMYVRIQSIHTCAYVCTYIYTVCTNMYCMYECTGISIITHLKDIENSSVYQKSTITSYTFTVEQSLGHVS